MKRNSIWFILISVFIVFVLSGCGVKIGPVGLPPTATATRAAAGLLPGTSAPVSSTPSPGAALPVVTGLPEDSTLPTLSPAALTDSTATQTITPWPNDSPTAGPSPTRTRTPTLTRVPTRTLAPTRTRFPSRTPTITLTPTPPAPVQNLLRPGLMSRVVSPIQVEMNTLTGDDGNVLMELVGEDGQVIASKSISFRAARRYVYSANSLPFEIAPVSEFARLQISSFDQFGRPLAISSVDLVLLSVGRSEIFPPAVTLEPFLVRSPRREATVTGGLLVVDGLARPVNDSPILLELVDESGTLLLSHPFQVDKPGGGMSHTPFHLEIPYRVSAPTPVRMLLRQEGSRIPGTLALNSQLLILAP